MNRRQIENIYVALYAIQDAIDAFKGIAKWACFAFIVWFVSSSINVLFAVVIFLFVPIVVGLFWALMYREAFDSGELKLEDLQSHNDDDDEEMF